MTPLYDYEVGVFIKRHKFAMPSMMTASWAAIDVNRAYARLYGDCRNDVEFARRFAEIDDQFEVDKNPPQFHGPAPFGPQDLANRGFGWRVE